MYEDILNVDIVSRLKAFLSLPKELAYSGSEPQRDVSFLGCGGTYVLSPNLFLSMYEK